MDEDKKVNKTSDIEANMEGISKSIQMITVLGYTMTVFGLGFTLGRYTKK